MLYQNKKYPKIIGLTKVRNESHIIKDTLDNWALVCSGGIYVYDDVSEDNTVEICSKHPSVRDVVRGNMWDPDREKAEWFNRHAVLSRAQQDAGPDDWFVYFDADEHIYNFNDFDLLWNEHTKAVACRLYDCYITPEDVDKSYKEREWFGPEYRTIIFFFRNSQHLRYYLPDQREITLGPDVGKIPIHGEIKHYGKGYSIDEWEKTCDYYIRFWPKYSDKWRKRKGKAVKEDHLSDFGNKLIRWKDRGRGFSLEDQSYGKS